MKGFSTSCLKPGWIFSDEGYSILPNRDHLLYRAGNRVMTITVDMGTDGFTVFRNSIARWDDDPATPIRTEETNAIAENIRRALQSQGQVVVLQ